MISLYLERPPGVRSADNEFFPHEGVRFAGEVETLFGIPQIGVTVTTILRDSLGQEITRWLTRTNIWGNYYADFRMPGTEGSYTLQAEWDPIIGSPEASAVVSFRVTTTPSSIGPVVNFDCSPLALQPGGLVKVTVSVFVDGYPREGASVYFVVLDPSGFPGIARFISTDSRGVAYIVFTASQLGNWYVLAQVYTVPDVPDWPVLSKSWTVNVDPQNQPKGPTPPPSGAIKKWLIPIGVGLGVAAAIAVLTGGRSSGPPPGR